MITRLRGDSSVSDSQISSGSSLLFRSALLPQAARFQVAAAHARMLIHSLVLAWARTLDSGLQNGNGVTPSTRSMMILAGFALAVAIITAYDTKERSESKTELRGRRKLFISHNSGLSFYRLSLSVHSSHPLAAMQRMPLVLLA